MARHPVTLYHAPQTRSTGALILLEELGASYTLEVLDRGKEEHLSPAFLAINPMGKVPALVDGGEVVTEQVAIFLHLADRFPEKGLAPALGDRLRGPYLRWMVFYAASFEPAMVDRAMQREPGMRAMSPYGSFDAVISTLTAQLEKGPYMLGERFSALDVLWGTALGWMTAFKLVPETPVIASYVERMRARPLFERVRAEDAVIVAQQAAGTTPHAGRT